MPKMLVSKSIEINKNSADVFKLLNDYHNWSSWSPWSILEKGVEEKIDEDGKYFSWVGDLTGEGNMRITNEVENKSVYMDLTFLKPWKSKAKVDFQLQEKGDGCMVTWNMESSLPFFLFFMKKMMSAYIGMDFDRGLMLLKEVAEKGKADCELNIIGNTEVKGGKYIGIEADIALSKMPEVSKTDFTRLMEFARSKEGLMDGPAFTIYHSFNPVKDKTHFVSAVLVSEIPSDLPAGFTSGTIPSLNTYAVELKGPYHHLGNAWTAIEMRARGKKFKKNKKVYPMEFYMNNPNETAPVDLLTQIHIGRN